MLRASKQNEETCFFRLSDSELTTHVTMTFAVVRARRGRCHACTNLDGSAKCTSVPLRSPHGATRGPSRAYASRSRRYANNAGIKSPRRTKNSAYERRRAGGRVSSAGLTRLGREGHNKNSGAGQPVRDADRPTQRRPASLAGAPPRYADRFCHYGTSGGRRQK